MYARLVVALQTCMLYFQLKHEPPQSNRALLSTWRERTPKRAVLNYLLKIDTAASCSGSGVGHHLNGCPACPTRIATGTVFSLQNIPDQALHIQSREAQHRKCSSKRHIFWQSCSIAPRAPTHKTRFVCTYRTDRRMQQRAGRRLHCNSSYPSPLLLLLLPLSLLLLTTAFL
jgi:hypothetical protein